MFPFVVMFETFLAFGVLPCNFSTTSHADLNYHIAKKHTASQPKVTHNFPGFNSLRQHRIQHKHLRKKVQKEVNLETLKIDDLNDENIQDKLQSCKQFVVDSEIENPRLWVSNYAIKPLTTKIVEESLDHVFKNMNCTAKVNPAFGFILDKVEEGRFKYFYAHEYNTLLDWLKVCEPIMTWQS